MSTISLRPQGTPLGGGGVVGWYPGIFEKSPISWDLLAQVMIIGAPQAPPTQRKILDSKCCGIRLVSGSVQSSTVSGASNTISSALFCLNGSRRHHDHSAFAFARESYREVPESDGTEQSETEFPLTVEAFATIHESSVQGIIISRLYRTHAKSWKWVNLP